MKKILAIFLLVCPILALAQDLVTFKLTPEGTFISNSGEDYVIVPFDGKSAHEIYQTLASNVVSVYNDPSRVMSGVDDASIKIRAYSDNLYIQKVLGISHSWGGYYQLEFRIKDGRVRVSAPLVENSISCPSLSPNRIGGNTGSFQHIVKKWFKNGEIKEKEAKNVINVELQVNAPINAILGLSGSTSRVDDDW